MRDRSQRDLELVQSLEESDMDPGHDLNQILFQKLNAADLDIRTLYLTNGVIINNVGEHHPNGAYTGNT